jgi:hypothetical protein
LGGGVDEQYKHLEHFETEEEDQLTISFGEANQECLNIFFKTRYEPTP